MHSTTIEPPITAPSTAEPGQGPFALDTILDHSTWFARRLSKKKVKLLTRIEGKVRPMLDAGERVRYVTFGSTVSFWEAYFLGWMMVHLNRRAILMTDRRILLLQIDSRHRPRHLVSQVRYASIRKVRRTLFGNTKITLDDGKTFVFAYSPKRDRRFLQRLTDWIDASLARDGGGWEDLCPHCYVATPGAPTACGSCGGGIKSARKAGLLSLLFPGLGDLYLGHRKLAILEIVVAALIWLSVLIPDPTAPLTAAGYVLLALFMVVLVHSADAVGTAYIARKGLYPEGRRSTTTVTSGSAPIRNGRPQ